MSIGRSLLKKAGLKEEEIVEKKEEELIIRPKQAGLSAQIDQIQCESTIIQPVGAWRIDGPDIPPIKNFRLINPQTQFCTSSTLLHLQTSICRYHEQFEIHKTNSKLSELESKARTLDRKIDSLQDEKKNLQQTIQMKQQLAQLLQTIHQSQNNFDDAFNLLLLLAANPSLCEAMRPKYAKYQQEKKNPFELSKLSMIIAKAYSSSLIHPNIFSKEHIEEWGKLRGLLFDVHNLSIGNNLNTVPDSLWAKFLRKILFPKMALLLTYQVSTECAEWADFWFNQGMLSESNLLTFFINVAKPFLIQHLHILCKNLKIHSWIELAQTPKLAAEFAVIVRLHADNALGKWIPPSPFAHELLQQWPHVLKNSLDFMYHTVGPKLSKALKYGDITCIGPWLDILPIDLTASIISDSYINFYFEEIKTKVKTQKVQAAELYRKMKNDIPLKFVKHPRIVNKLIVVLNVLKETNPILRSIQIEQDPPPSTVADLLQDIATTYQFEFISRGTVDKRAAYSLGPCLLGVLDGVLHVQKGRNWIPIFVDDIHTVVETEIQKQQE